MNASHFDSVAAQWDSQNKIDRAVFAEKVTKHVTLTPAMDDVELKAVCSAVATILELSQ
jgi:hypothetical protein